MGGVWSPSPRRQGSSMVLLLSVTVLWLIIPTNNAGDAVLAPREPVVDDDSPKVCWNFTFGDWQHRQFFSPNYPHFYPNETECMRRLEAPVGYRIRLDFRGSFFIEDSESCNYDYLELRDGPFGYSPLVGKYCGKRHPPIIESSSRYMWIRFKSDDSIEYPGFRAVYDFFKQAPSSIGTDVCRIEVTQSENQGVAQLADIPPAFVRMVNTSMRDLDCTFVWFVPPQHKVILSWETYSLTTPQMCQDSFVEIYERTTSDDDRQKKFCTVTEDFKSSSNHVFMRLYTRKGKYIPSFVAISTVFTPGPCEGDQFPCEENTCIPRNLVCNGRSNCNSRGLEDASADEATCKTSTESSPTSGPIGVKYHTVILGIVGGVIFIVIFLAVCITCIQKHKEDQRRKHVLRQEERHAMEIEMANLLNKSPQSAQGRQHGSLNRNTHQANHVGSLHRGASSCNARAGSAAMANHVFPDDHVHQHQGLARKGSYGNSLHPHVKTSSDYNISDLCEHNHDGHTFKRYLDVGPICNDDDSSPNPSTHDLIPTVVTIERPPSPRRSQESKSKVKSGGASPHPRDRFGDRAPRPRPDVVQEERASGSQAHPQHPHSGKQPRRGLPPVGLEAYNDPGYVGGAREKGPGDIWQPLPTYSEMNTHPRHVAHPVTRCNGDSLGGSRTLGRDSGYSSPPSGATSSREHSNISDQTPLNIPSRNRNVPIYMGPSVDDSVNSEDSSRAGGAGSMDEDVGAARRLPPAPPQRRTPILQKQASVPPQYSPGGAPGQSPRQQHQSGLFRSLSAKSAKKGQHPGGGKTPEVFYAKPNRGVQKQTTIC